MRYAYGLVVGHVGVAGPLGALCIFNVSPGAPIWPGSYLSHCRPGDFIARAQHVRDPNVGSARVQRGGRPGAPGDLRWFQHPLGRENAARLADLGFAIGNRPVGVGCGEGGRSECCLFRRLTLANNNRVDERVSGKNEASKANGNSSGAPNGGWPVRGATED